MREMDPTIPYMVLDIVRETLAASNDISTMQEVLTAQVREITGAKVVALIEFIPDKYNYHLDYVHPPRHNSLFADSLITMLIESWYDLDEITLLQPDDSSAGIKDFLNENRFQKNLVCPLIARNRKTGILLVFGLHDDNIIVSVRRILSVLLGTVAFILENSQMRRYQEKIIAEKTKELRSALIEAETANRAKSNFLANMSHEIRTPMNAILGFTDILRNIETDKHKSRFIDFINTSGHSLLNLINDILDISKIESGKMNLEYGATSLSSMCTEMETLFSLKVQNKGLSFEIVLDEKIPENLLLDEARLRQIFINLLSNALKFTHSGHISLMLEQQISCISTESRINLIIRVSDTGIGIPEDQLSKIFGSFEQVKGQNTKQYGGTGLGLAITRQIVELMGGRISVESEVGVGTTFDLLIPDVEIAAGIPHAMTGNVIHLNSVVFEPATILIVDDIDYNREILALFLSDWEFVFHFACNGEEAIKCANSIAPDIILLDMKMPVMDGYQASAILKRTETTKEIPIVAITASALKQDEKLILELCDEYLRKPVSRIDLLKAVMKFLPHRMEKPVPEASKAVSPTATYKEVIRVLANQPVEWLETLDKSIVLLDVVLVNNLINQIPNPEAVSALQKYVTQYDFTTLSNLCWKAQSGNEKEV